MEKYHTNTTYEPENSYQDDLDDDPQVVDPFMDATGRDPANPYWQLDSPDDDLELDSKWLEDEEEPDEMSDDDLREYVEDQDQDGGDKKWWAA